MSGNNEDYRKDWPEFKLLHKHGLIDDKFRYTKNGQFVDENGKPVNEKGQWVNDKGEPIDSDGKVIDQTPLGNMEDAVFLDD
jgi:flagellar basal body rod protein FlgG